MVVEFNLVAGKVDVVEVVVWLSVVASVVVVVEVFVEFYLVAGKVVVVEVVVW